MAGANAMISEAFLDKYKTGNFSHLPHLTGFMASEALGILPSIFIVIIISLI